MARLSMNELTTYRWSFEEDVRQYSAAGYDGIGVWREKLTDFGEENALRLLTQSRLSVSLLSWAGGFTGSDGRSHVEAIEDGLDAVRLAARLHADCLIVHSGARSGHTRNHVRRIFRDALKELLGAAEPLGVDIAIEPLHPNCAADWTILAGLNDAVDLLQSCASPRLKLALDAYHLGHDDGVLQRLGELAPHTAVVQLGDTRHVPGGEPDRCPLGEGIIPLRRFVSELLCAGFNGFFDVELAGEEIESTDYCHLLHHSRCAFKELIDAARPAIGSRSRLPQVADFR
jgi:sugar phosphate isomerase/epimerase